MVMGKRVWVIAGGAAAVVVAGALALGALVNADSYRGRIESALTDALGRPVQLGHLDASIFSGSLVASSPSIADDPAFSHDPFLTAKEIRIGVEMGPLVLHHTLHITGFTIEKPKIALIRADDGTWNYSSLGGKTPTRDDKAAANDAPSVLPDLTVGHIEIKDGTLTLGSRPATGAPHEYTDLNVSLENFSFAGPFSFKLSGKLPGDGTLDVHGDAGPIGQGDASLTPLTAEIALKHADLGATGLIDPGAGVGGLADLDAKIVSDGKTARLDGTLNLTHLRLAKNGTPTEKPVAAEFSVNHDLRGLAGQVSNTTLHIGKAALTVAGGYATRGNTITTQLKVNGQGMPVDDLESFLPALGVMLPSGSRLQGGTLGVALDVSGPVSAPVVNGPVHVENTQLAGFNLGQKLSSVAALTGAKTGSATTVQTLSSAVHYGPDGIRTDNLNAVVTGAGAATGSGSISPTGALDYHVTVKLSGVGAVATDAVEMLAGRLGGAGAGVQGGGIPLTIGGTTSNPTFAPDMSKMAGGVLQKKTLTTNPLGKLSGLFGR
ncbi:MAG TPA: DUF748 domain-containing protein [Acidobacteriaceae bacterium]|jgi:AsmA protein